LLANFELYKTPHYGLGTCVEVSIDTKNNIIRRQYKTDAITVNGTQTSKTAEEVEQFFLNEVYWLEKLQSKWLPITLDVNMQTRTIFQEYTHPDLLNIKQNLPSNISEQVVEMYKFFKENNVYKRNGSLSNLTLKDNQLVAFDFKWAKHRPDGIEMEIKSYEEWLSKINPSLTQKLKDLL
jgi:hypothetical protein